MDATERKLERQAKIDPEARKQLLALRQRVCQHEHIVIEQLVSRRSTSFSCSRCRLDTIMTDREIHDQQAREFRAMIEASKNRSKRDIVDKNYWENIMYELEERKAA